MKIPNSKLSLFGALCSMILIFRTDLAEGAGGLLLYTENGISYVSATEYVTFSPSSPPFIVLKGGGRKRIDANGIIAQIPYPSPSERVASSEAEAILAEVEGLRARYPQYATLLTHADEAWKQKLQAGKALDAVEARTAIENKKREYKRLVEEIEAERIAKIEQEQKAKQAEAERIAKIEQEQKVKQAEAERIAKIEQERKVKETMEAGDAKKETQTAVDEVLNNSLDFTIQPRGPEVHGLRLGMLYTDFLAKIKELSGADVEVSLAGNVDVTDLAGEVATNGKSRVSARYLRMKSGNENLASVAVAGSPALVIDFYLHTGVLKRLFKMKDMSFDDFCQAFINAYDIPKLEGRSNGTSKSMGYKSPEGWSVAFNGGSFSIEVNLYATPLQKERGFGL